jgi:hypothetical protein
LKVVEKVVTEGVTMIDGFVQGVHAYLDRGMVE